MKSNELPTKSVRTSQYRVLRPEQHEIRLIQLDGFDNGGWNSEPNTQALVCCSLQYVCLEDRPRYTALSYTWGDSGSQRDIILDGQRIQVTENLELALRHLTSQHDASGNSPDLLWVDAVCIDQQNKAERSQQVSQMGKIFKTAEKTIIWLGVESRDSDLAIETMTRLSVYSNAILGCGVRSWSEFPFDEAKSNPMARGILSRLDELLVELRQNDSATLAAITSIYEKPWFRRVWVIQERVLSRNCIVYCGKGRIPWSTFYRAFWLLCGIRDYLNLARTTQTDSSALAASLTAALNRVVPVVFTSSGLSLFQLFSVLSRLAPRAGLQASDNRDYVYSLLGLVAPRTSPIIRVDYSKGWSAVQTEVGQACLAHYGPCILSFAGLRFEPETSLVHEAPSWAPDWSSNELPQPLHVPSVFLVRRGNSGCPYSAAKSATQDLSRGFTANGRLALSAFFVDDVAHLGQPFSIQDDDGDPTDDMARVALLSTWLRDMDAMLPCINEVYRTVDEVESALWKTPIVDRAYVYAWETERASAKTYWSYQSVRAGSVTDGVKYTNIAYNKLYGRRPFRSAKGYIGLGPLGMCVGDKIWILPGANVPFVFRPAGIGTFLVIGEAYIHGIMDGELFESKMELQNITLV